MDLRRWTPLTFLLPDHYLDRDKRWGGVRPSGIFGYSLRVDARPLERGRRFRTAPSGNRRQRAGRLRGLRTRRCLVGGRTRPPGYRTRILLGTPLSVAETRDRLRRREGVLVGPRLGEERRRVDRRLEVQVCGPTTGHVTAFPETMSEAVQTPSNVPDRSDSCSRGTACCGRQY